MITLYDHIQELRAELRGCYMTRRDRAGVQAELARAVAEQAELDRAFDSALEALQTAAETVGAARKRPPPSLTRSWFGPPEADGHPRLRGTRRSSSRHLQVHRPAQRHSKACHSLASDRGSENARSHAQGTEHGEHNRGPTL
jgi:hypothetical protein